jgi:hypothetical protein
VYTIVRNADGDLDRWAASAREADVLSVADTGSSDATVDRARDLGIAVHEIYVDPFRYDVARNLALELLPVDIDLCVSLDADEVLLPGWRAALEHVWRQGATRVLCPLEWRWSDAYPPLRHTVNRIHVRHGYRWKYPVHEQLVALGEDNPMQAAIEIRHLRDPSRPIAGNLPLLRLGVREHPSDGRMIHMLANETRLNGLYEEARHHFHRALELALPPNERLHSMLMLAHLEPEKREQWLLNACETCPGRREPWCELAQLHLDSGRWRACRAVARTALKIHTPPDDYLANMFAWGPWPDRLAAQASVELGDLHEAAHHAHCAWEAAPWDTDLAALRQATNEALMYGRRPPLDG